MCNVNISTGEVTQFEVDASFPGRIPWHLIRTYASSSLEPGLIGYGWKLKHGSRIQVRGDQIEVRLDGGSPVLLPLPPLGGSLRDPATGWRLARKDATIELIEPDQLRWVFPGGTLHSEPILVARKCDCWGNSIEYEYDEGKRLRTMVDSAGRRLFWDYDRLGHLIEISWCPDPSRRERSRIVRYEFDSREDLIVVENANGVAIRYEYVDHRLVRVVERTGEEACYQYDGRGRCTHSWRSGGQLRRRLQFDDLRRRVLVTDSLGRQTLYTNSPGGTTIAEVDALGRERADVFDEHGQPLLNTSRTGAIHEVTVRDEAERSLVVSRNGAETRYQLDDESRPLIRVSPNGFETKYAYDCAGNLLRLETSAGAVWHFDYDARGDLVGVRNPRGYELFKERPTPRRRILRDFLGVLQDTRCDAWGRPIEWLDGAGNRMAVRYDACGNPLGIEYADGTATQFSYDGGGRLTKLVDEIGRVVRFEMSADGTRYLTRRPDGSSEAQRFDREGQLVELVNAKGEKATFDFDVVGRCTEITYFDGHREQIRYDSQDNPTAVLDGVTGRLLATLEYDGGKLVREVLADGTEVSLSYGPLGEVVLLQNRHAALSFEWNNEARVVQEQTGNATLRFSYDLLGNRIRMATGDGRRIEYEWDQRSRLARLTDSSRWTYRYVHNVLDLVVEAHLPNGLVQRFEYDSMHRMVLRRVERPDGTEVCSREFEYDQAGRLSAYRDSLRGTRRFTYDANDFLRTVADERQIVEAYEYDPDGNLLTTRLGEPIAYGPGDRVIQCGAEPREYDSLANLTRRRTARGDFVFEYDGENRLESVRTPEGIRAEFTYDPLARRLSKQVGSERTEFVWDGLAPLSESTNGRRREFLFLPGSFFLAGMTSCDGYHYSFVLDHLGTPTEVLGENGDIVWSGDYSAFGELIATRESMISQPFRFQGQYCDEESGLHYNRYRYYEPQLGRFTCSDPIGFAGGGNLYRYAPNPLNWVDPLGLATCEITPKCSWNTAQQEEAKKKAAAANKKIDQIGGGNGVTIPAPCDNRKNAKEIYDKCRSGGSPMRALKETTSKCTNEQADHMLEVCAGGGETDCNNFQPLNESVNKSFGSQMGACARKLRLAGEKLTMVKLLDWKPETCRKGGTKCPEI